MDERLSFESVARPTGTGTQGWRGAYHTKGRARNRSRAVPPAAGVGRKWEAGGEDQGRRAEYAAGDVRAPPRNAAQDGLASPAKAR